MILEIVIESDIK